MISSTEVIVEEGVLESLTNRSAVKARRRHHNEVEHVQPSKYKVF